MKCDDFNHKFPPKHRIVEGNYFELHKEGKDGDIYYIDYKKKAIISAYCVVGNCPISATVQVKKRGKLVEMYIIDHDLHQALCEIVNFSEN